MTKQQALQLFEERKVRSVWDNEQEKWYFSIVDVVAVLTDNDYQGARNYWKVLKNRLLAEGNQTVTNCNQLKLTLPIAKCERQMWLILSSYSAWFSLYLPRKRTLRTI